MAKILEKALRDHVLRRYYDATTPVFSKEMGTRMARARKHLRLTQRQLAEQLGISQTEVSRLESGKMHYASCNCARFNSVFGEHFEYVLTRSGFLYQVEVNEEFDRQTKARILRKANRSKVG